MALPVVRGGGGRYTHTEAKHARHVLHYTDYKVAQRLVLYGAGISRLLREMYVVMYLDGTL